VARLTRDRSLPVERRATELLLLSDDEPLEDLPTGYAGYLLRGAPSAALELPPNAIVLPAELHHLDDGDVVRIAPAGQALAVIYRKRSPSNSLLTTERCNHFCTMCSQPPKAADDSYLVDELLRAIPLFDPATAEIGLTGGEPTLLGPRLLDVLRALRDHLPQTAVHVLSNGRRLADAAFAQAIAALGLRDLMFGIPLYADIADVHDFVVQSRGAFDETIRGILNLKRVGGQVELRFVIHRDTYERLPQFAEFVARNLLFVNHVALMGLEPIGFAKANMSSLWVDPQQYQPQLMAATRTLAAAGLNVSIYNHQLCVLERTLWPYARRSISDWKNEYIAQCEPCALRQECGGFFSSAVTKHSAHIQPFLEPVERMPGSA
jgi:His-Xaa-Ser system radical SAM maturase HxsC